MNIGNEHGSIPFAIYADFESLLQKNDSDTSIIHNHDIMNYCYYVKPIDDVPQGLLEKYDIQTDPVIFRGNQSCWKRRGSQKVNER